MFLGFLSRTIIARHFSTGEYGVFNLALTVLSIVLVIATLGFQNSLPREVAFYREREPSRVNALVSTALIIVFVNSIIWTLVLILGSENIGHVFNEGRLTHALRMMAFALPFWALVGTVISISRGFGRVREQIHFQNVIYPTAFLVFIVLGVLLDSSFTYVFFAYVFAQALTFLALVFDMWRTRLFGVNMVLDSKLGKDLIRFSFPLMLSGVLWFVMGWTDTLMLGYYKTSEVVGLYNSAAPLAKLLPIFLNSAAMLYIPIASQLYAHGKLGELKRVYQVLTKWVFLLTLPVFSLMFLFPEAIISFFFGTEYVSSAFVLRILALGFMFHTILGLNGQSLLVIGKSDFIMISNLVSAIFNIILNALLIPMYGMNGAAIATVVSYFVGNVLKSLKLYKDTGIHPFSRNYVKPLTISFVLLGLIEGLNLRVPSICHAIPVLVVFLGVYILLVLLSRSIDREDVKLLQAIERRVGVNLGVIRKVLDRFS